MKHALSTFALGAALLAAAAVGHAENANYRAVMSGPSENPPNASPGSGVATFMIDQAAMSLSMRVPFTDLTTPTTVAHIHCCTDTPFSGTAAPASMVPTLSDFPVGLLAGMYESTWSLADPAFYNPAFLAANGGSASQAMVALIDGINAHEAYFNIHTQQYPNGEIRGFLVAAPVPEPGSWAMLGVGLLGLGAVLRRRGQSHSP